MLKKTSNFLFSSIVGLILISFAVFCHSQQKIETDEPIVTICWDSPDASDTSASYSVFWRNLTGDTAWKSIGVTDSTFIEVEKGTKKEVIFGVRFITGGDESPLHTSMDSNSCILHQGCGSVCDSIGSWYLDWSVPKPALIRVFW